MFAPAPLYEEVVFVTVTALGAKGQTFLLIMVGGGGYARAPWFKSICGFLGPWVEYSPGLLVESLSASCRSFQPPPVSVV